MHILESLRHEPNSIPRSHRRWPIRRRLLRLACQLGLGFALFQGQHAFTADFTAPDQLRKLLYAADADNTGIYLKDNAAFRYRELLYKLDHGRAYADFNGMTNLYGPAEQARAASAAAIILGKLATGSASDTLYGSLLLDLYYDRAVAASILAGNLLETARISHYGPPVSSLPNPSSGYVIDHEIPLYEQAVAAYHSALSDYFSLFTVSRPSPNPSVPENPGAQIFKALVPSRSLEPARMTNGVAVTADTTPLFNGYKDLVLLHGLLRDYGRAAESLVRLYVARRGPYDLPAAKALLTEAQRTLYLQGTLVRGLFPGLDPSAVPHSGLAESQAGWEKALASLDQLKQVLDGDQNLLGFAPDFLVLIQGAFAGELPQTNSYDAFLVHLAKPDSVLGRAHNALAAVRSSYANYVAASRSYEDELLAKFMAVRNQAAPRLIEIVGQYPYPGGTDDTPLPGSAIALQILEIDKARLQIERNHTEISNLKQKVNIELDRWGSEQNINNARGRIQIQYGNKRASLAEQISQIEAEQAGANELANQAASIDYSNPSSLFGVAGHGLNAVFQTDAELRKGKLEAEKERQAARESADLTALDGRLLTVNSQAAIKTWLLEMGTLLIDSQQAVLQLAQETGRLTALLREKARLEAAIAESDPALARRSFADPLQRPEVQSLLSQADVTFAEAQEWLFFMARALEFKWNVPLEDLGLPGGRTMADLFKARNADELSACYDAMRDADDASRISAIGDDRFDWFSVRENFLGYRLTNELGQAATYVDPVTGQTNNALAAFRLHLSRLVAHGYVELDFSTVRELANGSFFRGPDYDANGNVIPTKKGTYLDKINWVKIRLPGGHAQGTINGYLSYGGTSYLRNPEPGIRVPNRPDRLLNEMTAYSTRRWFKPNNKPWQYTDGINQLVTMLAVPRTETRLDGSAGITDPLPSVTRIDVFRERPVAASGWHLAIPVTGPNSVNLADLDDIEIYFYHWSFSRN